MPPPGFCAITVSEEFFDWFDEQYKKNKECGTLDPGICSFAAFFSQQLDLAIKEKNCMRDIVNSIVYVPKKFTQTKLLIKVN